MTCRVLIVIALVACGSAPPPVRRAPAPTNIQRSELPAELRTLVPKHGVYTAGGGAKSSAFRVVVDTDAKTIYTGSAPPNTPLHGKLVDERTRELTPRNQQHLMKLSADAWGEAPPQYEPERIRDYDEFLIVADGDRVFFLQGNGPITRPLAAKAIEALRAAAAL